MPWSSFLPSPSLVSSSSSSSPKSVQPVSLVRQDLSHGNFFRTFLSPFFLSPLLALLSLVPLPSSASSSFSPCHHLLHCPLPHGRFFSSFPGVLSRRHQHQELEIFRYTPPYYLSFFSPRNLCCPFPSPYSSFSFAPCSPCSSPLFIAPKLPHLSPSALRLSRRNTLYRSFSLLQSASRQSTWPHTSLLKSTRQSDLLRADRLSVETTKEKDGKQEKKRKAELRAAAVQEMKKKKIVKTGETWCSRTGQREETMERKDSSSGACRGFIFSWPVSAVQEEEIRNRKSKKQREGDGETKGAWERGRRRTESEAGEEGNGKNDDICWQEMIQLKRHDEEKTMGEKKKKEVDNKKRAERRMQSSCQTARATSLLNGKGIRRLIPKRK